MSADRIILIVCLWCLLASTAIPATKSEWRQARHAREAQFSACLASCIDRCRK